MPQIPSFITTLQTNIDSGVAVAAPTGTVVAFAGTSAPSGWLLCNGSAVSRTTYSALFSAIGVAHGYGDNSTTFNIPDYRGRFLRGVDGSGGNDPDVSSRTALSTGGNTGNTVGSLQGHSFQTHTHIQDSHNHLYIASTVGGGFGAAGLAGTSPYNANTTQSVAATNQNAQATGSKSQATVNETRPVNVAVNYIIKI